MGEDPSALVCLTPWSGPSAVEGARQVSIGQKIPWRPKVCGEPASPSLTVFPLRGTQ
jgi:hypothetical protein